MPNLGKALLWTQLLALVLLALLLYPQMGWYWQLIRGVCATLFILFVPGYRLSYIFFSGSELSVFERFLMSIASSIALISFGSFYLHYFSIALYPIHIYVLTVCIIAFSILCVRYVHAHREEETD